MEKHQERDWFTVQINQYEGVWENPRDLKQYWIC